MPHPNIGDVIIQGNSKNRNQWKLAIGTDLISEKDGIVRAAKLKTGKDNLQHAIQHLYPLELACTQRPSSSMLNPSAPAF